MENKINKDILNNDVCPLNQTDGKFKIYNAKNSNLKILFIGNSITLHEPAPKIGWNNNFGMAASSEENDYVHQVIKGLNVKYGSVSYAVCNASDWEFNFYDEELLKKFLPLRNFNADIIVFRIGENVNREMLGKYDYAKYFEKFVKSLIKDDTKIIVTNTFWAYDLISNPMEKVAKQNGYVFVNISDLGFKDENKAIGLFEHAGVASHPGDLGMKRIAERILKVL